MFFQIGILAVMLFVSIRDIRNKEILSAEIIACGVISILRIGVMIFQKNGDAWDLALSLLPGVFMLFISLISRQSLGFGDGLLALSIGPAMGAAIVCGGVVTAVFLCGIFSGFLVAIKKVKGGSRVPFVPFMTLGLAVMEFAKI